MCGFSGFISNSSNLSKDSLRKMLSAIKHRGPDAEGVWHEKNCFLGHRRLSILDLSEQGAQPMKSSCERYVVAFNGEIYNHLDLKKRLESNRTIQWRGHSDTEILLETISEYGIDKALKLFEGMFGFALWDKQSKEIILARDRFGEKPVYYHNPKGSFAFASELTSIEALPDIQLTINREGLCEYFKYGYFPAPMSIYNEISKLEPAHYVRWKEGTEVKKSCYWDIETIAEKAKTNRFVGTLKQAEEKLDSLLKDSISKRMNSDVPLGAFLSGGIDSTVVCAIMQELSQKKINTFSIGFDVHGFNEAEFAKKVSEILGTNHTEKYITADDALKIVPLLGKMYDEPFADSSQIPTYLVSEMAKEKVTVCLSGDGGDELFGGYRRYLTTENLWGEIYWIPLPLRKTIALAINFLPLPVLRVIFSPFKKIVSKYGREGDLGHKAKRLAEWLGAKSIDHLYELMMRQWKNPERLVIDAINGAQVHKPSCPKYDNQLEKMTFNDAISYLPGDILTKVDRATMAVSLEGRIPLLDHKIAEFALSIPHDWKWKKGDAMGKLVLRNVLYRYVPKEVMGRPKMGFGIPLNDWLKGPLKKWAGNLLDKGRIVEEGFLNPSIVNATWEDHILGASDNSSRLWSILMFQLWLEERPHLIDAQSNKKNEMCVAV
jgi:asparagine synthase (glutamine-hydrolysing)